MAKVKRTKNIFNQNIVNESLFQTEGQGQYKIGQLEIRSDWLRGAPLSQYVTNIYSSLKMAELRHELQKLKDQATTAIQENDGEISSPTKANLFKMTVLKKKISNFQVDDSGDTTKIQQTIQKNKKFKIAQAPSTDDMLIQKITTGSISFFQKPITRKVILKQKILIVESKKNEQKVNQWTKINLDQYKIEVDYKQPKKQQQLTTQNLQNKQLFDKNEIISKTMETFLGFQWVEGYNVRLLLSNQNQRPYCLYLKEENVQKLIKYLKLYNFQNTLVKKKSPMFSVLSDQLFQKVFTVFNNKLRMYDFKIKLKPELSSPVQSPNKNFLSPSDQNISPNNTSPKKSVKFSSEKENKNQAQLLAQSLQKEIDNKKAQSSMAKDENVSQIIFSPPRERRQSVSQYGNMSLFKLRTKKVTINYADLQQGDVNIIEMTKEKEKEQSSMIESPKMSPIKQADSNSQFKVFDFRLDLKQEGMSEADQNQSSRSMFQNRKRTTNLNVSARLFNQIHQKGMKGQDDSENNFIINIHEVDSDSEIYHDEDRVKSSGPLFLNYEDEDNLNRSGRGSLMRKNTDSSMSSLRLEEIDDKYEVDRHYSEPKNVSPRSFQSSNSGARSDGRMRLCLRQREPNMKGTCYSIEMLYPYHKDKLRFQILQVDPQIQMQKYQVVCSQSEFIFSEKVGCSPRYSMFQQTNQNSTINLIGESNNFIFILKEQGNQNYYSYFQVNMKEVRYQKDMSQLILIREEDLMNTISEKSPRGSSYNKFFGQTNSSQSHINRQFSKPSDNKNSYKFAAIVRLYFSPYETEMWPQMSTVQFLSKYIEMTIHDPHYDFKYNFMDKKKRYFQIKDEVNKRCVKQILKVGIGKQNKEIKSIVFSGLPPEVVGIIQKKLQKEQRISKEKIWSMINFQTQMPVNELKLLEESIIPPNLRVIRLILKPLELIQQLLNFKLYNKAFLGRIYEIAVFFLQQNPFTNIIQNFIIAVFKEILLKLEKILFRTKNQEEIKAIIKVYLEVQYEIDEFFEEVRKYFV